MQDESNNQTETHQDIYDEGTMLLGASLDSKDCFVHLKKGCWVNFELIRNFLHDIALTFTVVSPLPQGSSFNGLFL